MSVLLLVLPVAILLLPFSAGGSRLLVFAVDALSPVQLEYGSGSLADHLQLTTAQLLTDSATIEVRNLELELEVKCLLTSKICLRELSADQLLVSVTAASPDTGPAPDADRGPLEFPVEVESPSVTIGATRVSWAGGSFRSGPIRGGLTMSGSRLMLRNVVASDSELLQQVAADTTQPDGAIELPQLKLPFHLVAKSMRFDRPGIQLNEWQHRLEQLELSGRWRGRHLDLAGFNVESKEWGELSLSGEVRFRADWPLSLRAMMSTHQPPVWEGLHNRYIELTGTGSLVELQLSAESEQPCDFEMSGQVNALDRKLPFELQSRLDCPERQALEQIPGLDVSLPDIELEWPWQLSASGDLERQGFVLEGSGVGYGYEQIDLAVQASHRDGELTLARLQFHDRPGDSQIAVQGSVVFADLLRWDLTMQSPGINLPAWGDMETARLEGGVATSGQWGSEGWQMALSDVAFVGAIDGAPATIEGYLSMDSETRFGASDLRATTRGARLSLLAEDSSSGLLELRVEELGFWLDGARGALTLEASLDPSTEAVKIKGEGHNLAWQDVTVDKGRIDGYYDIANGGAFELSLQLLAAQYGEVLLNSVTVKSAGNRQSQSLEVATEGAIHGAWLVVGQDWGSDWSGALRPTSVTTPGGTWRLDDAVELSWHPQPQALEVAPHCWSHMSAGLCVEPLQLGANGGSVNASAQGDLQIFDKLFAADMSLTGFFESEIHLQWEDRHGLQGSVSASVAEGGLSRAYSGEEVASISWDGALLEAEVSGERLAAHGSLQYQNETILGFELTLPEGQSGPLAGAVNFEGFVLTGILKPFLPRLEGHGGLLHGGFELSGSLEHPRLHGELQLVDGWGQMVGNPTRLEQMKLNFSATGNSVDITGGLLLGGGETQLAGTLEFAPQQKLELQLTGERQTLLWPPDIQAVVSENLRLYATADSFAVTGDITVHEGLLEKASLPVGSVDISPDVVQVDFRGDILTPEPSIAFATDINVHIENNFQVIGPGLEAVVGGGLNLQKSPATPLQLFGELNVVSGELSAFGQGLKIVQGNLSFTGDPDNPSLAIRGEREIREEGIRVGVDALGDLEEIDFHLYSSPPLPENQIMSYLIRGRGLDSSVEGDGTAVALAVGLGAVNQTGVTRGANKIPGLSNVSFGTEGTAQETAATVGGFIGERIYLSYGVGVYEPINVLTARFYLLPRLWVEVVSRLENSVDIYYSLDIK